MSAIEIRGLEKSYRVYQKKEGLRASLTGLFKREYHDVHAVRGIDLNVEQGEFVAFLGPNGAGKTTTLKLLSGVISPSGGEAHVLGHVPWKRENEYRRRFALVMGQKNQLWWDLPAQESFQLHQKIYRIDPDDFRRTRDELVDLLEVRHLLGQPVRELSLGERMKMELTAALLHSPDVLFLDEPTIGLDVVAQYNVQRFLKHYQTERKITILLTSHYMKDVAALCRRVVIIATARLCTTARWPASSIRSVGTRSSRCSSPTAACRAIWPAMATCWKSVEPRPALRVDRGSIADVLSSVLASYTIEDVSVEDPPLEEVIAEMFTRSAKKNQVEPVGAGVTSLESDDPARS